MRRLSAAEFDAVMLLVKRMSVERRAAARAALVDGIVAQTIADQYGWRRTAVNSAESVVWSVHQAYLRAKMAEVEGGGAVPRGWARETVTAPRDMLRDFKQAVAALGAKKPRRQPS